MAFDLYICIDSYSMTFNFIYLYRESYSMTFNFIYLYRVLFNDI